MQCWRVGVIVVFVGAFVLAGCQSHQPDSPRQSSQTHTAQTVQAEIKTASDHASPNLGLTRRQPGELLARVPPTRPPQEMILVSIPVAEGPSIDGHANEPLWATAPAITTLDYSSQRPISLKSVYTADEVFFLITYPDDAPSETHKTWVWDAKEEIYREGTDREDVFVFKWSMAGNDANLTLRNPAPHHADIWFWKAFRTNPAAYADDKWHIASPESGPHSRRFTTTQSDLLYFRRWGDAGNPAFEERFFYEYNGATLIKYFPQPPTGSRGDVRAKGVWHDGQWSIEFARKLDTGHDDDVTFTPGGVYLFGVARYAMAYDTPHQEWSQPLYRTGDVFDRLLLAVTTKDIQ